jgi:16S rRNA (guanine527-N7)-methyltransferase
LSARVAELPTDAQRRLEVFQAELARWGRRINLVGSTDRSALSAQIEESLAPASMLPSGGRIVDLGSGAGLPGIPLAIARPDVRMTLVDRRQKKINFLRYINRLLSIGCEILGRELERGSPHELFDVALIRAVAPLRRARELASGWVRPEGALWLWTREQPAEGEEIAPLGSRGRVVRLPCPGVSRGTAVD